MLLSNYSIESEIIDSKNKQEITSVTRALKDEILNAILNEYLKREPSRNELNTKLDLDPLNSKGDEYFVRWEKAILGVMKSGYKQNRVKIVFNPEMPEPLQPLFE